MTATAQVTQFAQPGWRFLNSGSGYLGGSEANGSYVTLKSPDNTDYSTIIETTTATAAQAVTVNDVNSPSPATDFVHSQDLTASNGSYLLTVQTDQFDNLKVTANPAGNIGGVLRGLQSGKCVDVAASSQADGALPALRDCTGGTNQIWTRG